MPGVRLEWAPKTTGGYRFLVGGHLYGAHGNTQSRYPASSFLANFDRLNHLDIDFMISLGDIVRHSDSSHFKALQQTLRGLNFPVFNAPGNHDLADGLAYLRAFLLDQTSFQFQGDYFILLNTEGLKEPGDWSLTNRFVEQQTKILETSGFKPRNVFVCSHRLFWSQAVPELAEADVLCNEPIARNVDSTQVKKLYAAIQRLCAGGRMHWLAGDVGAEWSVPLVTEKVGDARFIATGIGDGPDDRMLLVDVDSVGAARFEVLSLLGDSLPSFEAHNLAWAKQYKSEHEGPSEWGAMLRNKRMWLAFVLGVILGALLLGIYHLMRRNA